MKQTDLMHEELILEMIKHEEGCPERIQHFMKVLGFATLIGRLESIDLKTLEILKTAAVVHDIGIRTSLLKYKSSAGPYQELEGPPIARMMLEALGYDENIVDRVCFLVGHHHTYDDIDGIDYQILVEADFLVNVFEGQIAHLAIQKIRQNIFRTNTGLEILDRMYPGLDSSDPLA